MNYVEHEQAIINFSSSGYGRVSKPRPERVEVSLLTAVTLGPIHILDENHPVRGMSVTCELGLYLDWLNSALSPVVYGDIALSINT